MYTEYFLNKTLSAEIAGDSYEAYGWRVAYMRHRLSNGDVAHDCIARATETIAHLEEIKNGRIL